MLQTLAELGHDLVADRDSLVAQMDAAALPAMGS